MLSVAEVESILESHVFSGEYAGTIYEESGWDQWDELVPYRHDREAEKTEVPELGTVEMIRTYTGGEGGGEYCEMIFKVTAADGHVRYFRQTGYYASYDGTTWDGAFTEVRPREKMITVYE